MQLLKVNEIECLSGGLDGQLDAEFYYRTPYNRNQEGPSMYYTICITGPADEILAKIKTRDYPLHLEGIPDCKLSSINIKHS